MKRVEIKMEKENSILKIFPILSAHFFVKIQFHFEWNVQKIIILFGCECNAIYDAI